MNTWKYFMLSDGVAGFDCWICWRCFQDLWELWYRIWHSCFGTFSPRKGWRESLLVGWTIMLVCLWCLFWFSHHLQLLWRALRCGLLAGKRLLLKLVPTSCGKYYDLVFYLNSFFYCVFLLVHYQCLLSLIFYYTKIDFPISVVMLKCHLHPRRWQTVRLLIFLN